MSSISGGGGRPPKGIDGPRQPQGAETPAPAAKDDARVQQKAKTLAGKLQFTNEELAQLAATFAGLLKQNPRADRKQRAKLFAKAILQKKRIAKLFEDADEEDVEKLFEDIAEQLDGSPVFAQL